MSEIVLPEVKCSTAEEFFQVLSPVGEYLTGRKPNKSWLFRGQGEDWDLIPSLFRTDAKAKGKFSSLTTRDVTQGYEQLLMAEKEFIVDFFDMADKRGYSIPDDSQELRIGIDSVRGAAFHEITDDKGKWLESKKALSLVALAQHYGIPTRLLDWTLQPLIAAFFAAEGGVNRYHEQEKKFDSPSVPVVVWAFDFPQFGIKPFHFPNHPYFPIRSVTASGASNPNLKAQQGVFTLLGHEHIDWESHFLPFDKSLERLSASGWSQRVIGCRLQKFTLPVSESFKLLGLLADIDIAPSTIYPGYHSIVSDMQNQRKAEKFLIG